MSVHHQGFALSEQEVRRLSWAQRRMRSSFGVKLVLMYMFLTIVMPSIYVAPTAVLLGYLCVVQPRNIQRFFEWGCGNWLHQMVYILEYLLGLRVRTFGFGGKFKRKCLFIMNHRTHMDWMFFWAVVERQGDLSGWKAVCKDAMKSYPLVGIALQYMNNIFLSRKWEKDKSEMDYKLKFYSSINGPLQMLLFPEGTDLSPHSKAKADEFADTKQLPHYNYCLHPRSTGFVHLVQTMRKEGLEAVYDITIGFPDVLPKTEYEFMRGAVPSEIHYYIQEYPVNSLPSQDDELGLWCEQRWAEKEERLRQFYVHREFLEVDGSGNQVRPHEATAQHSMFYVVFAPLFYMGIAVSTVWMAVHSTYVLYYGILTILWTIYHLYFKTGLDYATMEMYYQRGTGVH